ncbi:MAG: hypothetical protein LBE12_19600 [Planctomycetaceae bacterium]|jgi:hypothetical protein|nr:hypothetical protein [Planctomycetaceae bacterium]
MNEIFPLLGDWNKTVCNILKQEYLPKKYSENIKNNEMRGDKDIDYSKQDLSKQTIWKLICTETIDTEYSYRYDTRVDEEILHQLFFVRNFS